MIDFVSPHYYDCVNLAGVESDLAAIRRMLNEHAPSRAIKVAVTEWNTTAGDWGPRRARLWTLENALACSRYHNLLHRHCDQVAIACRSNLINSFCSGFLQTDNHRLFKTPTYYAQKLYSTLAGDRPLELNSGKRAERRTRHERNAFGWRRCRGSYGGERPVTDDRAGTRLFRV